MTAQPIAKPTATTLEQLLIERVQAGRPRHRNQQVAADPADQSLDLAFVVAFAGPAKPIGKQVMRLQLAEYPRALPHSVAQDARHRQPRVVVEASRCGQLIVKMFGEAFAESPKICATPHIFRPGQAELVPPNP